MPGEWKGSPEEFDRLMEQGIVPRTLVRTAKNGEKGATVAKLKTALLGSVADSLTLLESENALSQMPGLLVAPFRLVILAKGLWKRAVGKIKCEDEQALDRALAEIREAALIWMMGVCFVLCIVVRVNMAFR
jgi:hypothetical protein